MYLNLSALLRTFALSSIFQFPISRYPSPVFLHRFVVSEEPRQSAFPRNSPVSLPYDNPTKSFWTHGAPDANPLAVEGSQGDLTLDADTVIIGSGITGVGAAYHLSQLINANGLSHNIVILEARDFCSGATGRNGGHLIPRAFQGFRTVSDTYNIDEAIRSISLENYTTASILSILKSSHHETQVDLVSRGHVDLFFSDEEELNAKSHWAAAKKAGIDVEQVRFLSKYETQLEFGPFFPSVRYPGNNLWPLKAVTQFFRLAQKTLKESHGTSALNLHTHTPVLSIKPFNSSHVTDATSSPHRWRLETPRGHVYARNVIHATNGYAAHLLPFLEAAPGREGIAPTRGQVISTRASVGTNKIVPFGFGANDGFEYWFPRPLNASEGRNPLIILGGGRENSGASMELGVTDDSVLNPAVSDRLRGFLPATYPDGWFRRDTKPEMEWTGIMGYTPSTDPFVGPVMDTSRGTALQGQYIAAGYTGHGMPRGFGCAEALAQMIISEIKNETWSLPEWLPEHYLTTSHWRKRVAKNLQHGHR